MDRYTTRGPPPYGQHPPPPPPPHEPHRPPPPHYAQPAPHSSHHAYPPQQPVAPSPQQQHQPPPPSQHHPSAPYSAPPPTSAAYPPPPPRAQPYPPQLPPIQSEPYAAARPSSEQSNFPPYRPSSAQPSHEQQREGQQQYPPERSYNRSGHATPAPASAPVNRTYSHDSGQQRTPATPTAPPPPPPHFSHSSGHEGAQQPPPPPPPQSMDHGGHPGYPPTNGVPHHGMPHAPPPHHEQHPQYAMTPMMDQHHQYPPPGQAVYGGAPSYGPTASMNYGPKRKQMRATQACENCRQRKQKCDEGSPCSFCKENNMSCQYRDTPPAKTDKNMEKLLTYMESYQEQLSTLGKRFDLVDDRLQRIEHNAQNTQHSSQLIKSNHTVGGAEQEAPQAPPLDQRIAPAQKLDLEGHRTAPHKLLLLWPSVFPLVRAAEIEVDESYVMEAEDRGTLRLWTRGEGIDPNDGTHPGYPASPAHSDECREVTPISTPPEGLWGTGFPSTPGSYAGRSEPSGVGGLKANGQVDLDAATVNRLYDSYINNIHIMHPFLDQPGLRQMFNFFIERYSGGKPRATWAVSNEPSERPSKRQRSNGSGVNVIGGGPSSDSEMLRDMATERSPGNAIVYLVMALGKICLHEGQLPHIQSDTRVQTNTINSQHARAGRHGVAASSPMSINFKQSPRSPRSTSTSQPTPPAETYPRMQDPRSRRSSVDGSPGSLGPRNLDVIPGLAYYARAAEILGAEMDGNQLVHAQMFLLAGLYKGQLARVKESMSFITMAGRVCLMLLDRGKLYQDPKDPDEVPAKKLSDEEQFEKTTAQYKKNQEKIRNGHDALVVLAAHTCSQLESDILAEMRLPASGIQTLEDHLLQPNGIPQDENYDNLNPQERVESRENILFFYSAQMFLRKRLNDVHRELYGQSFLDRPLDEVQDKLKGHQEVLHSWRNLADKIRWNDEDPPARDILNARIRAKYWGARYVINRPFLDYVLHIMPHVGKAARITKTVEDVARDGNGTLRNKADIQMFKAIEKMGDAYVWTAARDCVEAAMQSTVAFDGIIEGGKRLIVTNIHGTAHAQFGNMLVLSAVYNSDYTRHLVPAEKLKELLTRTIKFLRDLAPISPTCSIDCGILEAIERTLFSRHPLPLLEGAEPTEHDNTSTHSSFRDNADPSPR